MKRRLLRLITCLPLMASQAQAQAFQRAASPVSLQAVAAPAVHLRPPENAIARSALPYAAPGAAPAAPALQSGAAASQARLAVNSSAARTAPMERILQKLRKAVPSSDLEFSAVVSVLEEMYAERASKGAPDGEEPALEAAPPAEGLPIEWVRRQLEKHRRLSPAVRGLQKKTQWKGIETIGLNPAILARHNDRYTTELPVGRVTDQKQSGRCWIFAGLNMIRSTLIAQGKVPKDFEFSENHLYFFSQLERANRHLERVIQEAYSKGNAPASTRSLKLLAPSIGDEGNFVDFKFLVEKYGLLAKSAMPETKSSAATLSLDAELNDSLALTVKELALDARRAAKTAGGLGRAQAIRRRGMSRIAKILSAHLGTPPERFDYAASSGRKRSYTPKSFARNFVGFQFDDYVQVASWPFGRRGVAYELEDSAIGAPGPNYRHLNVDMDRLEALSVKALEGGQPVYIYIAMGRGVDNKTGIMHSKINDHERIYGFSRKEGSGGLTRAQAVALGLNGGDHLMVLTGFDRPDPKKPVVKFKVENSWSGKSGDRGVYHMYREWFRRHAFNIIVHKRLLTKAERAAWTAKAEPLKD